jgi:DNA gyrase subunit B
MTDADVDGAHIRTLLLTLFYRHFPQVIENGHLYIAQPPLFGLTVGRKRIYAYDEAERESIIDRLIEEKKNKKKGTEEAAEDVAGEAVATETDEPAVEPAAEGDEAESEELASDEDKNRRKLAGVSFVQRYKGLGEMNDDQLWETTMDPANRVLLKVAIEDAEKADAIFNKLMGEEVLLRKNFISSKASTLSDEDLDI